LFLDARAALQSAERVAAWMAAESGFDDQWQQEQIKQFENVARHYLIN
jgi:glycerol-3-phosphate dehydrogenase